MIVGIHQPNYLPWAGYFHKIAKSDVFVFLDNVPFSKDGYQNRVEVKTPRGRVWLTQPVLTKDRFGQLTSEVELDPSHRWREQHLKTLEANYRRAPFFDEWFPKIAARLRGAHATRLADVNIELITFIARELGFKTRFTTSTSLGCEGASTGLLIDIVKRLGGHTYLSGQGGRKYQDDRQFEQAGIHLAYSNFAAPTYPQLWGAFENGLSVIDLLMNSGEDAQRIIEESGPNEVKDAARG